MICRGSNNRKSAAWQSKDIFHWVDFFYCCWMVLLRESCLKYSTVHICPTHPRKWRYFPLCRPPILPMPHLTSPTVGYYCGRILSSSLDSDWSSYMSHGWSTCTQIRSSIIFGQRRTDGGSESLVEFWHVSNIIVRQSLFLKISFSSSSSSWLLSSSSSSLSSMLFH